MPPEPAQPVPPHLPREGWKRGPLALPPPPSESLHVPLQICSSSCRLLAQFKSSKDKASGAFRACLHQIVQSKDDEV